MTVSTSGELLYHLQALIPAFAHRAWSSWNNWVAVSLFLVESNKSPMYVDFRTVSDESGKSIRGSWHSLKTQIKCEMKQMHLRSRHVEIRIHRDHHQLSNSSKEIWTLGGLQAVCISVNTFHWWPKRQLVGNDECREARQTDLLVAWDLAGCDRLRMYHGF